ncbi:type II toxin-antitoxin system VapC family toxin [Neorhizobium galegae]|uniref:PIN domain-containing protein n=1 Tax=Neorhizobium galegae TaxID=399 RepID=UPI0006223A48|nr:type II toxin-antitoxin system VapC family toxin [Neorhizobium galegae]MCQ1779666.1 type II toxin-antitoxin system VapC family toxin [Neorhizobium galegae]MCQ1799816.1 type II toxin-antitoxin system VapC family toxin [Neorhizobium galegae]CDZ28393.1 Putative nucleic-acid-binding protein, contains PIN domain-containing protein [Neorhizobium galegae bv. officinalis]
MTLLGLDTNVILRTLIPDNALQVAAVAEFAKGLGREYSAFVTLISLLELDWALRSQYGFKKKEVVLAIGKLLRTRGLVIENQALVVAALWQVENTNVDFADALIAGRSLEEGCKSIKTFDKKAASHVPGMEFLA